MDKIALEAKARDVLGRKTNKGRKEGLVPAVVYGKGVASKNIWVKLLDFKRLIKKSGESTVIELKIDEKDNRNENYFSYRGNDIQFVRDVFAARCHAGRR